MENDGINSTALRKSARIIARGLIRKCKITEPPVSLRLVVSELKKSHRVSLYPASGFSDRLSGILVTIGADEERQDEIHFNENHSWHRRRFSIAHEIGHILFNSSCGEAGLSSYESVSQAETEANLFAAELLMPSVFLKKDVLSGKYDVPALAWRYIVSAEAMGWRLVSSRLLK